MSEYLQDPLSDNTFEQITAWQADAAQQTGITHWLVADGTFAPHRMSEGGLLKWQAVFTQEPMSQYEEMGLFIAPIPSEPLQLRSAVQWMKQFDGQPMFSVIDTHQDAETLKRFLTWVADAYTDDGLSVYLRIGDARCLPYILSGLTNEQYQACAAVVVRWTCFARDGDLSKGLRFKANQPAATALEIMQKPFTINEQQYVKFVEGGEVDLIYSRMLDMAELLFMPKTQACVRYAQLNKLHKLALGKGLTAQGDIFEYMINALVDYKESKQGFE
jgi:hypothetical protein